jgi:hypothetical protein
VDAGSTLYEIAKLDEPEFEKFAAEVLSGDQPIKRSDVVRFKGGHGAPQGYSLLATVEVHAKHVDQQEVLSEACQKIMELDEGLSQCSGVRARLSVLGTKVKQLASARNSKHIEADDLKREVSSRQGRLLARP